MKPYRHEQLKLVMCVKFVLMHTCVIVDVFRKLSLHEHDIVIKMHIIF